MYGMKALSELRFNSLLAGQTYDPLLSKAVTLRFYGFRQANALIDARISGWSRQSAPSVEKEACLRKCKPENNEHAVYGEQ